VRALLAGLKADPANGIERIIERDEVAKLGGDGDADFYVNLGEGMAATGYLRPGLPLRFPSPYKGMHGYFPDDPRMASTFLIKGPGIAPGRDLGRIDMRAIAPTLEAQLTGAKPRPGALLLR
jgi:predicted AlkP superfamily pyrophosphatase or phosphodiesterase